MTVINTNVKSLVAANALAVNNRALSTSMQQLSTGKRINSASDDAAGLAIAAKMTSQIRGLDQAVRNGNDGISMLQTAEGAMVEMSNMVQRMRELAVQSTNDTNTSSDRTNLNSEFQSLKNEITRIGANTQWNGMNVLNGSADLGTGTTGGVRTAKFQIGSNTNQAIDVSFNNFTFTAADTATSTSTTTLNLATKSAGTDAARLLGTFGTVSVDISFSTLGSNPDSTAATALAGTLQTKLQAYAGLEGVTVAASGEIITITDASGKAAGGLIFKNAANTADATTAGIDIAYNNGPTSAAAAPANGVFSSDLAAATIGTQVNANLAIAYLDSSLASLNTQRSTIGATVNRLTYAVDNLTNVSQNTSASRSRVEDTDYAKATTELARTQIIQQAATAMLAQANQSQQSVLALLK